MILQKVSPIKYDNLHTMLVHPGLSAVHRTSQAVGIEIAGKMEKCTDCQQAK